MAMGPYTLAKLYLGAQASPAESRSLGQMAAAPYAGIAAVKFQTAAKRRAQQLDAALKSGKLTVAQMGPADKALFGIPQTQGTGSHFLGPVGQEIGRLGSDIFNAGRYLVPGLANLVIGAAKDVYHQPLSLISGPGAPITAGLLRGGKSETYKNQIKPMAASYADTYGHGVGHFLDVAAQHPLGPILDAATLLSLGGSAGARLGGAVVRRVPAESSLAKLGRAGVSLTSRGGRAPFIHPDSGVPLPREYTPRPVSKLLQKTVLDPLTRTGVDENLLGKRLRHMEDRKAIRRDSTVAKAAEYDISTHALQGMESIAKLGAYPDEALALNLAQRGVNTADRIEAFQKMVHENNTGDPTKLQGWANLTGTDPAYFERMSNLPPQVKHLILNPSERMIGAHELWKDRVNTRQQQLIDEGKLTPERIQQHLANERAWLDEHLTSKPRPEGGPPEEQVAADNEFIGLLPEHLQAQARAAQAKAIKELGTPQGPPPDYEISHVYVPTERADDYSFYQPGRIARAISGRTGAGFPAEGAFVKQKGPLAVVRGQRYDQKLFAQARGSESYRSSGETFQAGAFRTDSRLYLDYIVKRAKEAADNAFRQQQLERMAYKDPATGEMKLFKDQDEINRFFPGRSMVFVNPEAARAWFPAQVNSLKRVEATLEEYYKDTPNEATINPFTDPEVERLMERIVDEDSNAFVKVQFGSTKKPGAAVGKDQYDYMQRMFKLDEPFTHPVARFYTRAMHIWRTGVLTLMPRWALNTGIGSMVMNSIRGVNVNDYIIASKLHKAGFLPENLGEGTNLPPGVSLGHQEQQSMLEAAGTSGNTSIAMYTSSLGIRVPTRTMLQGVQNLENIFRRAQFIHNLRREQRLARDQQGRIVDVGDDGADVALQGISDQLVQHYNDILGKWGGDVSKALSNSDYVTRALQETDKMMYNYSILGPTERRAVRNVIPFWGWFKFISTAAYRMPVEYPGRMNLLKNLSNIAVEQESEMGPIPQWLRGSIPWKLANGQLSYFSTLGANPFSQVFNPIGPQGLLGGSVGLGQGSPLLQAGLSAYGLDTLTGDRVRVSPESGVTQDFLGRLVDANGNQVSAAQVAPAQRLIMGLARSFPEYRIGERAFLGPQYPESVPFLAPRQMGPNKGGAGYGDIALQTTGLAPKSYDLGKFQQLHFKAGLYSRRSLLRAKLRQQLKNRGLVP